MQLFVGWGCNSITCTPGSLTTFAAVFIITPICLFRHFGHFAFISIFSVSAIIAILALVIVGGPLRQVHGEDIKLFSMNGTARSLGSIVFSLGYAQANFQAFNTTESSAKNSSSWIKITLTAVFIGTMMCMGMGIIGYMSFRDETEGNILDNYAGSDFDFFKIMIVIHLILYMPINFVIMRYSFVKVFYGNDTKSEELPWLAHLSVSLLLLGSVIAVVLVLFALNIASGDAFGFILNLTGGIAGTIPSFILPAAMYLKVCDNTEPFYWPSWVELILGTILGVTVTIETILSVL